MGRNGRTTVLILHTSTALGGVSVREMVYVIQTPGARATPVIMATRAIKFVLVALRRLARAAARSGRVTPKAPAHVPLATTACHANLNALAALKTRAANMGFV